MYEEDFMSKNGKIVLAVTVTTTVLAASAAAAAVYVCRKIYQKKYFTVY